MLLLMARMLGGGRSCLLFEWEEVVFVPVGIAEIVDD